MVNYYSAMIKKILTTCFGLVFGFCVFGVGLVAIAILVTYPKLPSLDSLQHYQPKMPLTIYSADGEVIGMYGEQRREFTKIGDFLQVLRNAVIAAEDKRFSAALGGGCLGCCPRCRRQCRVRQRAVGCEYDYAAGGEKFLFEQ